MTAEWPASGGGGGAPSGPAGGDLSGTYPNPGIGSGVIVNADVNASAAIAKSKLAALAIVDADVSAISPSKVTGTAVVTADSRLSDTRTPTDATVTDAKIATTLSPSKITGTAVVTADARLSDARTPTAHQSSHMPNGSDALPWSSSIFRSGLESAIPAPSSSNAGLLYLATDTQVVYQSTGSAWTIYAWDSSFTSLLNGGNNNIQESYPRMYASLLGTYLTSGVMSHIAVVLRAGTTVTNLTTYSANVSPSAITNWWFALYDNQATPALMSQTADQGAAAIPNLSRFTLALQAPQTITVTGVYWMALMVKATTVPSFLTRNTASATLATGVSTQVRAQGTSGSGLTTTAPATIASPTAIPFAPYMAAS